MVLEKLQTIQLPAVADFNPREHFTTDNKEVSIGYISSDFKRLFVTGNVSESVTGTVLAISKLTESAHDDTILQELGDIAIVPLPYIWKLLKRQPHGEGGLLLANGYSNIFYVRAGQDVWAADCFWDSDYRFWNVVAFPVTDPRGWREGDQVISRDYSVPSSPQTLEPSGTLNLDHIRIGGKLFRLVPEEE